MFTDLSPWSLYQFDLGTYYFKGSGTSRAIMVPLDSDEDMLPFERGLRCSTMVDVDGVPTQKYTWAVNRLVEPDLAWDKAVKVKFHADYMKYLEEYKVYMGERQDFFMQMGVFFGKLAQGDFSGMPPERPVEPFEPILGSY